MRGAKAAKDKLLQYYRSTDDTPIYAVATAMHPAMRFDWWTREPQNWETEVVDEAKRAVTEIWSDQYKPDPHQATAEQTTTQDSIVNASVAELDFLGAPDPKAISNTRHCELEEYVAARYARVLPLEFWQKSDMHSASGLPNLAKMARDFLAVPATSASSERSFSKGRARLPYTRNRLGGLKVQEEMLMNEWIDTVEKHQK